MCDEIRVKQNGKRLGDLDSIAELARVIPLSKIIAAGNEGYQDEIKVTPNSCLCPVDMERTANGLNIQNIRDWDEYPWGTTWEIMGCEGEDSIVAEVLKIEGEKEVRYKEYLARKASSS